ncbi:hypothetical protein NW755_008539 [Fusarium falciforme]|uniref:Peptidase S8/S53 domain-containing protein n=1 Tax=Fusarium falciforme TaxID=195108 RepID=A0A9W8R1J3_9HYPO|nr:hypothetical protein NW755_008539 [Fusarium falciforme]
MFKILELLETEGKALLATAAGNDGTNTPIDGYPTSFAGADTTYGLLNNMIVVGASDQNNQHAVFSQGANFVAALAAYFRALPSPWQDQLREPANVKKLIMILQRAIAVPGEENLGQLLTIWNSQVGEKSCLPNYDTRKEWDTDGRCLTIGQNLDQITENPYRDDAGWVTWWGRLYVILGPDSGDGNSDSDRFSNAVN